MPEKPPAVPRIPFDPYDVFGYLIPGGLATGLLLWIEKLAFQASPPYRGSAPTGFLYKAWSELVPAADSSAGLWLCFLLGILAVIYIVGHIVATISALFLDKLLVERVFGYPYVHVLDHCIADKAPNKPPEWFRDRLEDPEKRPQRLRSKAILSGFMLVSVARLFDWILPFYFFLLWLTIISLGFVVHDYVHYRAKDPAKSAHERAKRIRKFCRTKHKWLGKTIDNFWSCLGSA